MALEHNNHMELTTEGAGEHFSLDLPDPVPTTVQAGEAVTPAERAPATSKKTKQKTRQRPCRFFARGKCRDGEKCKFSRQPKKKVAAAPEPKKIKKKTRARKCKYFAWNKCRDGDKCKFSHDFKNGGVKNKGQKVELDSPPRAVVVLLAAPTEYANALDQGRSQWSDAQQRALDLALKKYPASMDMTDRWTSIANEVEGRSLSECIDRFKMLCEFVRSGVDPITLILERESQEQETQSTEALNARITPSEQRVAISTDPEVTGTQICLENLFLYEVGTLVAHQLVCQLQCDNCPLTFDANLSLNTPEIQRWCPRCSVLHQVLMRPVFAHSQSDVLAYVDTENCSVVDVLPSDMLATCLECGCEALLENVAPSQRLEQTCFSCHTKLAVMARRFLARQLEGSSGSPDGSTMKTENKQRAKKFKETFVLGQPLPRYGACNTHCVVSVPVLW